MHNILSLRSKGSESSSSCFFEQSEVVTLKFNGNYKLPIKNLLSPILDCQDHKRSEFPSDYFSSHVFLEIQNSSLFSEESREKTDTFSKKFMEGLRRNKLKTLATYLCGYGSDDSQINESLVGLCLICSTTRQHN